MSKARSGTVLIVVAGVAALLAMMSLAFLGRVRTDVEEMQVITKETQARLMLNAACMYILEASRIGWDKKGAQKQHLETYGWIDVRDGTLGPRVNTSPSAMSPGAANLSIPASGKPNDPPKRVADPGDPPGLGEGEINFPIGKPFRFVMHAMNRPPFAITQRAAYNPVDWTVDAGNSYLRYPDPLPAVDNGSWERTPAQPVGVISNAKWSDWEKGDATLKTETVGRSWFRLVRENTGAIFTVTCGAGGTFGYKDWAEVTPNDRKIFLDSKEYFNQLAAQEIRLWYRVEWSAATTAIDLNFMREHVEHSFRISTPTYSSAGAVNGYSGQMYSPNMGGTIQWIQRLRYEPGVW